MYRLQRFTRQIPGFFSTKLPQDSYAKKSVCQVTEKIKNVSESMKKDIKTDPENGGLILIVGFFSLWGTFLIAKKWNAAINKRGGLSPGASNSSLLP